ncbi:hypothetical protein GLOIN_2v1885507 [Rhizophagus irregularis DAOM 181602=DAOM 197198]|nr:hypothetical protein GLOIN_2v1885507 [Rhizophagus irregularis DAOM 181602=DAOM 197198]
MEDTSLKTQITKLAHTLQSQEQYIKYLYGKKNAELRAKLKKALETASLKEEGLQALERQLIEVDTLNIQLKDRIKELANRQRKNMAAIPPDPITEILNNRTTIANSVAGIRIHLDRTTIAAHPHINHLFNTANDSLDAIIRYANELRNIIEDQDNMEDRLEGLLDDAHNREEYLRHELNNTRATILRTRRTYEDAYANKVRHRQHWEVLAQNTQIQLANIQAQYANSQIQLANVQRERDESRRNAHRLLQRYNTETERSRRRANGIIQQARAWRGQFLNCRNHSQNLQNQVNNLNQQILALQNNPPVIQQPIMAGYAPKKFRGASGEDPELWLQEFRQWCESAGLDPAANARTRVRIHGVFETLLEDDARDWYETHIKGKNWECVNLLDNTGVANLAAFNALNNGAIQAVAANQFRGGANVLHGQAAAVNTITGANFIPDHTVWDEDWSTAEGRPTDIAVNNPNANNGGTIVAPGIRIGQLIYRFKHYFPTITSEKSKLAFNAIVQGSDTVSRFYSKLRRMVRLAYPTLPEVNQNELVRQQFLNGLSSENKLDARRIGLENSVASILNKLEEVEKYRTDMPPTPIVTYQDPTLADIENLINSKIPMTTARSSAVPVPSSSPFSSPQNDTSFQRLLALAYKLGLPRDIDISKVTLSDLEIFIDTELNKNLPSDHIYRGNQVFGISSGTRKPKKSKKCSSCGKSGHTKSSCPKSKKGKRKTNYAHDSSDSSNSSDASDSSDSSDSDSDSRHACYGLKKKPTERKRVDKKPTDKKKSQLERQRIIFEVFIQLLKLLVQSFVNAVPKETVISAYNALNAKFINYKEPVLSQLKGEPSIKTREKVWDNVKDLFTSILHPMISVVTNSMAANLIRKNDDVICNNDLWSSIAGIGIVNRKSASDVVTIKTKVVAPESEKSLVIPTTIFDTGSDSSLISNNIVKRLNLDVDRSNAPDLSGVATKSDTIGTVYGLGILVYDGENSKKIEDDFMVVKSDKDFLLLGVPWIDRANVILDFQNRQLTIPLSSRKKITIPISLHKRKTNVTSLQMDTIDLKKIHTLEED